MEELKGILSMKKKGEREEKQELNRFLGDVLTVTEVLQQISLVKGVKASFIVDSDGLLVAGTGMEQTVMENIGGLLNTFYTSLNDIGEESKLGGFNELALTFGSGRLFFRSISPQFFYIIVCEKDAYCEKISTMMDGYRSTVLSFLGVKE